MNEHFVDRSAERNARPRATHVETGQEARQASLGRPILYVLIGGLLLGGAYIIGTQIWNVSEDVPEDGAVVETIDVVPPAEDPAATPAPNEEPLLNLSPAPDTP